MKKHGRWIQVGMASAMMLSLMGVHAAEFINATGGKWEEPTNWDTVLVPGGSDTITIAGSTDQPVLMDADSWTYLSTNSLLNNATRYRTKKVLLAGTGTTTVTVDIGAGNQWQATDSGTYSIGSASGSDGTFHVLSGLVNFEASIMKLGENTGSTGTIHVTGADATYIAGRASGIISLSVGPAGEGAFYISDGTFQSRMGVSVGEFGTFEVAGSDVSEVGVGSYSSLNGHWEQSTNGVLKVGIDSGGITPIHIDDVDNDAPAGFSSVTFDAGALLEPYFIDGIQTGKWTVMTVDGSIEDDGLALNNGGDTNWSFNVVSNYILEVWYGLGDSGYEPPEAPAIVYTNATCIWDGEAGDADWDNPTNWAFEANNVLPDPAGTSGATLQFDTLTDYPEYTLAYGSRNYNRMHIGSAADGRLDVLGSGYTLTAANGGSYYIGTGGNTGILNVDGGATLKFQSSLTYIGNGSSSTGIVNCLNGGRFICGRESGGISTRVGNGTGAYGELNVIGTGRFYTRAGVALGVGGSTGLFSVKGSGATILIGSEGTLDGSWVQNSGSTLRALVTSDGLSTIFVDDKDNNGTGGDVTFQSGALLDVSFADWEGVNGSWDIMNWEGNITDNGLAFAPGVDTGIWSFSFVEGSTNGVDTLRLTATGLITDPTVQPDIIDASVTGSTVSLTWNSEPIVGYNILSTTDLLAVPWTTNVAGITGMGASTTTNLIGADPTEFYKIEAFGQ